MSLDAYVDGSCLNNADPENRRAGYGYVVVEGTETVDTDSEHLGAGEDATNNFAEYAAVIGALEWRDEERSDDGMRVHTDSELVVNQTLGHWSCNEPHLQRLSGRAAELLGDDDELVVSGQNRYLDRAHELAQRGARGDTASERTTTTDGNEPSTDDVAETETTSHEIDEPEILDSVPDGLDSPHDGIRPRGIPDELLRRKQWVNWSVEYRDGKETKVPRIPGKTNQFAKSNDPSTWTDVGTALDSVTANVVGIGYVLHPDDPYVALDFDDCRDRETYVIDDWVLDTVDDLGTFAQVSTSNTGLHAFVADESGVGVPDAWTNKEADGGYDRELEVYDHGRFIAMTGQIIDTASESIRRHDSFPGWLLDLESEVWDE